MSLIITKAGVLTTVQDLGREGYRRQGINPGGVMDRTAARLTNLLIGNDENAAVIEMHFPAPRIRFGSDAVIAVGGADFSPQLDGGRIVNWKPMFVAENSVLQFAEPILGNRSYLAVAGGLDVDEWLGSSSTNLAAKIGGFEGRKLADGDEVKFLSEIRYQRVEKCAKVGASLLPLYSRFPTIRVTAGAEFEQLDATSIKTLIAYDFVIANESDRMGFRLDGEALSLNTPDDILSSAVSFGTVQLLPDGHLIVLMADHQTTGGYPRIANVAAVDLPLLAQLGPGDKVAFHIIERDEAEQLALDFERELRFFRVGCRLQARSWMK